MCFERVIGRRIVGMGRQVGTLKHDLRIRLINKIKRFITVELKARARISITYLRRRNYTVYYNIIIIYDWFPLVGQELRACV